MKYMEWVRQHGHIDQHVKGHLPHDGGKMTHDELIKRFGHKIKQAAEELGIDVDDHDLCEIPDWIYGLPDIPFHRSHYDFHC